MAQTVTSTKRTGRSESSVREVPIRPSITRVLEAIRRIGHSPEDAVLDIIDNSVANHATHVGIVISGHPGPVAVPAPPFSEVMACSAVHGSRMLSRSMRPRRLRPQSGTRAL